MKNVIVGAAVFVVSCSYIPGTEAHKVREVERAVSLELRFPDGAKFRNVKIKPTGYAACGEVNSKNDSGGYTGFKRFLILDGKVNFEPERRPETLPDDKVINNLQDAMFPYSIYCE